MKKLVILKTGTTVPSLREQGEDFEDWIIAGSGLDAQLVETLAVFNGDPLPDPERCAGLIVTGSPAFVTDREPWSEACAAFLRLAVGRGIPILGICYGHQLLAHSLGGKVGFHPDGREIGTVNVALNDAGRQDPLLGCLSDIFPAQVSHSQTVLKLPGQAVLLAANEFEPHHAFRVGDNAWGVQFHPEFSDRVIRAYIKDRRAALQQENLDPAGLLAAVRETPESATLLRLFAKQLDFSG